MCPLFSHAYVWSIFPLKKDNHWSKVIKKSSIMKLNLLPLLLNFINKFDVCIINTTFNVVGTHILYISGKWSSMYTTLTSGSRNETKYPKILNQSGVLAYGILNYGHSFVALLEMQYYTYHKSSLQYEIRTSIFLCVPLYKGYFVKYDYSRNIINVVPLYIQRSSSILYF